MRLKIAVVGGGSTYAPELIVGFAKVLRTARSPSSSPRRSIDGRREEPGSSTSRMPELPANPLDADYDVAAPLLEALLDENRAHLPRFARR